MGCKNGRQINFVLKSNPLIIAMKKLLELPQELNNVNTNLDDEKKKTITDLIYSSFFLSRSIGEIAKRNGYIQARLKDLYSNINWNVIIITEGSSNFSSKENLYFFEAEILRCNIFIMGNHNNANINLNNDIISTIYDSARWHSERIFDIKDTNFNEEMKKIVIDIICSSFMHIFRKEGKNETTEYITSRLRDFYNYIIWSASIYSYGAGGVSKNGQNYYMHAKIIYFDYDDNEKMNVFVIGIKK